VEVSLKVLGEKVPDRSEAKYPFYVALVLGTPSAAFSHAMPLCGRTNLDSVRSPSFSSLQAYHSHQSICRSTRTLFIIL
jgi:hypothetical protein